jgi:hypothetical protein
MLGCRSEEEEYVAMVEDSGGGHMIKGGEREWHIGMKKEKRRSL